MDDEYWIFPTYSAPYDKQVHFDAFSSPDLVNWTKHERIIDTTVIKWAHSAVWAPSIIKKRINIFFFLVQMIYKVMKNMVQMFFSMRMNKLLDEINQKPSISQCSFAVFIGTWRDTF